MIRSVEKNMTNRNGKRDTWYLDSECSILKTEKNTFHISTSLVILMWHFNILTKFCDFRFVLLQISLQLMKSVNTTLPFSVFNPSPVEPGYTLPLQTV